MNKLLPAKRTQILSMLCEGSSMRSTSRVADVSLNTVDKLLRDAGKACAAFHDQAVRNVKAKRVQVDEVWSFVAAKEKNVPSMKKPVDGAGDVWTWTGIDAESKLIVSWLVGDRSGEAAKVFMDDLVSRLATRVRLTSDGHRAYLEAVEGAFGTDVDFAQLVKLYGQTPEGQRRHSPPECIGCECHAVTGKPDPDHISTSFVERSNLTLRMANRRFTRLTNAFSKKIENHCHMVALYTVWDNFVKMHKTLKMTPALAAGVSDRLWSVEDIVALIDAREPVPKKRGPYKPRNKG